MAKPNLSKTVRENIPFILGGNGEMNKKEIRDAYVALEGCSSEHDFGTNKDTWSKLRSAIHGACPKLVKQGVLFQPSKGKFDVVQGTAIPSAFVPFLNSQPVVKPVEVAPVVEAEPVVEVEETVEVAPVEPVEVQEVVEPTPVVEDDVEDDVEDPVEDDDETQDEDQQPSYDLRDLRKSASFDPLKITLKNGATGSYEVYRDMEARMVVLTQKGREDYVMIPVDVDQDRLDALNELDARYAPYAIKSVADFDSAQHHKDGCKRMVTALVSCTKNCDHTDDFGGLAESCPKPHDCPLKSIWGEVAIYVDPQDA